MFLISGPCLIVLSAIAALASPDDLRPDRVIADFEGATYGAGWRVEGTAFGAGPARGALPGQMSVTGFEGAGLVNSFAGGDDAEGILTAPPIVIDRKFINLLVGGGKYPGETCVDLVIEGQTVRTATGPNDRPGGFGNAGLDHLGCRRVRRQDRDAPGRRPPPRGVGAHQPRRGDAGRHPPPGRAANADDRGRLAIPPPAGRDEGTGSPGPDPPGGSGRPRLRYSPGRQPRRLHDLPRPRPVQGGNLDGRDRLAGRVEDAGGSEFERRRARCPGAVRRGRPTAIPFHQSPRVAQRPEWPGLA